jgi:hypothetical protein
MKKETAIRIFCGILIILGAVYYFYVKPESFLFYLLFSPMILLYSLLPTKKTHIPDYSGPLSFIGILFAISSYLIYFTDPEIFQNIAVELTYVIVCFVYFIFLAWYKEAGNKNKSK